MEVLIAGEWRTWTKTNRRVAECFLCYSRSFKRSKILRHWYCQGCNEDFADEKPWFSLIACSTHGEQLMNAIDEDEDYWCSLCEEDTFVGHYGKGAPANIPSRT